MAKGMFITATGTDIGKTYVTALLVKKLRECGYDAGYYKAALSGAEYDGSVQVPGDADYVNRIAGIGAEWNDMVSYVYDTAVSPHLASKLEGNPVEISKIKRDFTKAAASCDYLTMEGSGGIICPIRYDGTAVIMLEDLIRTFKLPSLVIANAGLGTINSVVLTTEYMKQRGLLVKGIILNEFHAGNVMEEDNKKMIEALTGIPVLAVIEHNAAELKADGEFLAGLYEELQLAGRSVSGKEE